jgi:hypothetical protein
MHVSGAEGAVSTPYRADQGLRSWLLIDLLGPSRPRVKNRSGHKTACREHLQYCLLEWTPLEGTHQSASFRSRPSGLGELLSVQSGQMVGTASHLKYSYYDLSIITTTTISRASSRKVNHLLHLLHRQY